MIVTTIIAFSIMLLLIAAMSIGYILRKKILKIGCLSFQKAEIFRSCGCQQSCQERGGSQSTAPRATKNSKS